MSKREKKNTLAFKETKRPAGIRSNAISFLFKKKRTKEKPILICSPQTLDKMFSTIHGRIFPRILCTKRAGNSINNAIVIGVTKVRNLEQSVAWIL